MAEVLVVDDERALRMFLVSMLADEGYTVAQVADGRPALDHLRERPSGLVVLLDLHMPVMSGYEVLRVVEADAPRYDRHAFIVLTAQSDVLPPNFMQLLQHRQIPLFAKPCDPDELLAAVATAAKRLDAERSGVSRTDELPA